MKTKWGMEGFIVPERVTQFVALMEGCMATNVPCVLTFCEYWCGFLGGTQKVKWQLIGMMSRNSVEVIYSEFLSSFIFSTNHNTTYWIDPKDVCLCLSMNGFYYPVRRLDNIILLNIFSHEFCKPSMRWSYYKMRVKAGTKTLFPSVTFSLWSSHFP